MQDQGDGYGGPSACGITVEVESGDTPCHRKGDCLWHVSREQVRLQAPPGVVPPHTAMRHGGLQHFCPVCDSATFDTVPDPLWFEPVATRPRRPASQAPWMPYPRCEGRSY
ncbi:hypothetical protein GGR36_000608 [Niveibacterium umoris]|uniref:CENP-V/GFA domain-containing protein n=1 Tax=Niveibacterium umoris TaxID=1193620 RepID=A0A840BE53_9RHOO|nr:hypothetical protein [Niveibacterium umoris]